MAGQVRGRAPHFVDVHLGRRVRALRKLAKQPLCTLAERVGVAYQQLQKYETGVNRMSASTLYEIANALQVRVEDLYSGLPGADPGAAQDGAERNIGNLLDTPAAVALMQAFVRLPDEFREPVMTFVTRMAKLPSDRGDGLREA
jgi:transcriptional regulator with XRE-family HTH domain